MKKIIAIAAVALMSTSVAAATSYRTEDTNQYATFVSDSVGSEAEAQSVAEAYIASLEGKNGMELSQALPTPHSRVNTRTLDVVDTEWAVVHSNGQYKAKVDVAYTYEYRTLR